MINYKHPLLPELQCFIKNEYIHFYCNGILFESSYKKVKEEQLVPDYLDKIFSYPDQVKALLYAVKEK